MDRSRQTGFLDKSERMNIEAQVKAKAEPRRFPTTIPHQTPLRPIPRGLEKIHASGVPSTNVRTMVTTRAFFPLPTPWNIEDENIPKATPG